MKYLFSARRLIFIEFDHSFAQRTLQFLIEDLMSFSFGFIPGDIARFDHFSERKDQVLPVSVVRAVVQGNRQHLQRHASPPALHGQAGGAFAQGTKPPFIGAFGFAVDRNDPLFAKQQQTRFKRTVIDVQVFGPFAGSVYG